MINQSINQSFLKTNIMESVPIKKVKLNNNAASQMNQQ